MFVVMFVLLNNYAITSHDQLIADFNLISSAEASQEVTSISDTGTTHVAEVSLSPATQLVSSRDLAALDRNTYYVDEELGAAIKLPPNSYWEIKKLEKVYVVGISDIPIWDQVWAMMSNSSSEKKPKILAVTHSTMYDIELLSTSTIESIPLDINFYDIPAFRDSIIARSIEIARSNEMMKSGPVLEDDLTKLGPNAELIYKKISKDHKAMIDSRLPVKKQITNAVYVISFEEEYIKNAVVNLVFPRENLLDATMNYLWRSKEFAAGKMSNLYVNHTRNLISFNGSVRLGGVKLNGKQTDMLLNNIGFLTQIGTKIVFIQLVYLSSDPIEVFQVLKETLDSLQLST